MKPVRIYGDPFGSGTAAAALRSCLQACAARGFTASLCLSSVQAAGGSGARTIELGDGARTFQVATDLAADVIAALQRAAATAVPSTAPLLVFAPQRWRSDLMAMAGLEWPHACAVLDGRRESESTLLDRVDAELRWAGAETPSIACEERVLEPWLQLPPLASDGVVLHVAAGTPAAGTDVALRAFLRACGDDARCLRIVLADGDRAAATPWIELAEQLAGPGIARRLQFVAGPLRPEHARDAVAILQPLRRLGQHDLLPQLLASGRPVVATRWFPTAQALGAPGTCMPVGGRLQQGDDGLPFCEPDEDNVVAALRSALGDADAARRVGHRARNHTILELTAQRPSSPPTRPATPRQRPVVVLEAPFFEVSSAAELSIETARALLQRDHVDLRLVPTAPLRSDFDALRRRAPELLGHLVRDAGRPDLWLSSGWPPRAARPQCGRYAVRLDWEYGALPTELLPLCTEEADTVVVHSRHVERTVVAAGCAQERVVRIPHGVDATLFHEEAPPDPEVLQWKGDRPAVLFVGGLVFRKGFDVLLRMALAAGAAGARFVLVIKSVGHDQHYSGFHMGDLARRFQAARGAPPLLLLDGELPRARMPAILRACDLLCHPYRGEGFGMPVLEARACGLPVVVTGGGATDDFVADGGAIRLPATRRAVDLPGAHTGQPWLLEPDVDAAAAALTAALAGLPELRAAARAVAPGVRATHTWDRAAAAIEALVLEPADVVLAPPGARAVDARAAGVVPVRA